MRSSTFTRYYYVAFAVAILQNFILAPAAFSAASSRARGGRRRQQNSAHFSRQDNDDGSSRSEGAHIIFPGGGIFFYWQAGVVSYLREQGYDLSSCTFSGASAGALTATLTAGEVDFYEATDLALSLAAKANVWDRSSGLQGIWGPLIFEWLDTLLPNSLENIDGRLSLLVTPIPSFGKTKVSEFTDKDDLIRCNMASVHIVRTGMRLFYRFTRTA
jgi:predicted acylesterase/phospholipase RssA